MHRLQKINILSAESCDLLLKMMPLSWIQGAEHALETVRDRAVTLEAIVSLLAPDVTDPQVGDFKRGALAIWHVIYADDLMPKGIRKAILQITLDFTGADRCR